MSALEVEHCVIQGVAVGAQEGMYHVYQKALFVCIISKEYTFSLKYSENLNYFFSVTF